jgi:hypothetical protein
MMNGAMDKPMRTTMCTSNAVNRKMFEDTQRNSKSPCKEIHSERHDSVIVTERSATSAVRLPAPRRP